MKTLFLLTSSPPPFQQEPKVGVLKTLYIPYHRTFKLNLLIKFCGSTNYGDDFDQISLQNSIPRNRPYGKKLDSLIKV